MKHPRRFVVVALFLLALVSPGQAQEEAEHEQGKAAQQQQPTQPPRLPFPVKIVEDQAAAEDRKSGEAEARQAAQRMAEYSLYQTVAVVIGNALLFVTMVATWRTATAARAGTRAAIEATEVQKSQMDAALEPFLTIEVVEKGEYFKDGDFKPSELQFKIRNHGQSVGIVHTIYRDWRICNQGSYPKIVTPSGTHAGNEDRVKSAHIPVGACELSTLTRMTPETPLRPSEGQSVYFQGYFLSRNLAGDEFEDGFLWVFIPKDPKLGVHLALPHENAEYYNYHRKKTLEASPRPNLMHVVKGLIRAFVGRHRKIA